MTTSPDNDLPEGMGHAVPAVGGDLSDVMGPCVPAVGGDLSDVMGPCVPAVGGDDDLPESMGTVSG